MNESQFLDEIKGHPFEMEPRMVYADWLEERGDERAEFLRLEEQLDTLADDDPKREVLEKRISATAGRFSTDWVDVVCRRYDVLLHGFGERKLMMVKAVRCALGVSLLQSKQLVESTPTKILRQRTRFQIGEFLSMIRKDFKGFPMLGKGPALTVHAAPYPFDEAAIERIEGEAKRVLESTRVLVTGDRDFADRELLFEELDRVHRHRPITQLIHGDARGAERLSGEWAVIRCVGVLASVGRRDSDRNRQLLRLNPDLIIACSGGSDTEDMVQLALNKGIEVIRLRRPERPAL